MTISATSSGELLSLPAMLIRGGTSRGVHLLESDLPADRTLWGPLLIALFGARDVRQLDGLGGGLFPTGNRSDVLDVPGVGEITCSIIDLANMCVFFRAEEAGLTGYETIDRGPDVVGTFIAVRQTAQRLLGADPRKTTPRGRSPARRRRPTPW